MENKIETAVFEFYPNPTVVVNYSMHVLKLTGEALRNVSNLKPIKVKVMIDRETGEIVIDEIDKSQ